MCFVKNKPSIKSKELISCTWFENISPDSVWYGKTCQIWVVRSCPNSYAQSRGALAQCTVFLLCPKFHCTNVFAVCLFAFDHMLSFCSFASLTLVQRLVDYYARCAKTFVLSWISNPDQLSQ